MTIWAELSIDTNAPSGVMNLYVYVIRTPIDWAGADPQRVEASQFPENLAKSSFWAAPDNRGPPR